MKILPRSPRTVLSVLGAIGVLTVVAIPVSGTAEDKYAAKKTQSSIEQIHREIAVRSQSPNTELNGRGFPSSIDPSWFRKRPENYTVSFERPWVDIASVEEADRRHPEMPIAHEGMASFWYNPALGVIRARVPAQTTDRAAHLLYCKLNSVDPDEIPVLAFAR